MRRRPADHSRTNPDRPASAVAGLKRTGATAVHVTADGIRAELPPGSTGTVVIAAPRIAGWTCRNRPADNYLGRH
ncbi:hypothetical protein [Streptomyces atratus]|uniref:hypothetical protein n=1 Tax=Streptomyces atratus TaxID=1893 RepID=UPI0033EE441B